MKIPLFNLPAQHAPIRRELLAAFKAVLARSNFVLGEAVEAFEREFAKAIGAEHAVGVANGTDALELALKVAGVGRGHEVIVPAMTFAATAHAVVHVGARPRFVDVDERTATIDVALAAKAVTRRTKAVIPVHLYGQPADMDAIRRLGLVVVEDCAQAIGATWKGRAVGTLGDFGAFSFYPSKNLGALGDGGLVTAKRPEDADALRMWRHQGQRVNNRHDVAGFNSRLDALQAAFLSVKLRRIGAWNRRRRAIAAAYRKGLRGVSPLAERPGARGVFHLYAVRTPKRDELRRHLDACGVATGVYYPTPVPRQPAMRRFSGRFPMAERLARELLTLPIYPELTGAQVRRVIDAVNQF